MRQKFRRTAVRTTFMDNNARYWGGAFYVDNVDVVEAVNCTFMGNKAGYLPTVSPLMYAEGGLGFISGATQYFGEGNIASGNSGREDPLRRR